MAAAALVDEMRTTLRRQREESGETEATQAAGAGMSPTGFNDFMCGDRGLGPRTWQALYRTHHELRALLENYQREAAFEGTQEAGGTAVAQRRG